MQSRRTYPGLKSTAREPAREVATAHRLFAARTASQLHAGELLVVFENGRVQFDCPIVADPKQMIVIESMEVLAQ